MSRQKIDLVDKHVGMRLRLLRNNQNLTREELALGLDISSKHLTDIERGEKRISPENMKKITQIFATTASFFFIGLENELNKHRN